MTSKAARTAKAAPCACGLEHAAPASRGARKAHGVDAVTKAANLRRLRRIEGQVRGLQKMIAEDRYCADVMTQIGSVHEALRAVGRGLMGNHLRYCAASAIRGGDARAREAMYDELVELMYRHAR
jgi:CsoR family transcriptional regulator, copper-sensing transcriptional repressor